VEWDNEEFKECLFCSPGLCARRKEGVEGGELPKSKGKKVDLFSKKRPTFLHYSYYFRSLSGGM
jgi:hypothetical protein